MRRIYLIVLGLAMGWFAPMCYAEDWIYTARPGDTIWELTEKYAKSLGYVEALRKHNNIEAPKRIQPGTRLRFPVRWLKVQPASARITEATGEASLTRAGNSASTPVAVGDILLYGDVLETGDDANIVVKFADGSTLAVRDGTSVEMDKLSAYGDTGMVDTRLRLQRGRVNVRTTPSAGPGSKFRIHTPAAVSTVRGTRFRVAMDPESATARTEVTQGVVGVGANQKVRQVPMNFGIVAEVDKPLAKPVKLLPPADLSMLPSTIERVPVKLDWGDIEGAVMYRVQVSKSDSFDTLLVDRVISPSAVAFDIAVDGEYVLRLRGIDAEKLEGVDVNHRFLLNAYPVPPISVSPRAEEIVRIANPEFQWTIPKNSRSYFFQLARDPDFSDKITDAELSGDDGFKPEEPLEPGRYFWRLATKDKDGEIGPFGDIASFSFTLPQRLPDLTETPPEISKDEIAFRWQEGIEGSTYRVQIARGKRFKNIIVDEVVDVPSYVLPEPKGGHYSIRIAAVEPDGFEGEFSDPQTYKVDSGGGWWAPLGIFLLFVLAL